MKSNPHSPAYVNSSRHEDQGNAWMRPSGGGDKRPCMMPISFTPSVLLTLAGEAESQPPPRLHHCHRRFSALDRLPLVHPCWRPREQTQDQLEQLLRRRDWHLPHSRLPRSRLQAQHKVFAVLDTCLSRRDTRV